MEGGQNVLSNLMDGGALLRGGVSEFCQANIYNTQIVNVIWECQIRMFICHISEFEGFFYLKEKPILNGIEYKPKRS